MSHSTAAVSPRPLLVLFCALMFACGGGNSDSCPMPSVMCGGVCTNTTSDNAHCGTCDNACGAGEACSGGMCALSCQAGQVDCNGTCVDPNTDRAYCGAGSDCTANAGTACGDGFVCDGAGTCALSCQSGLVDCNGTCVDPNTDRAYCGAGSDCSANAGTTCGDGFVCDGAGACALSCQGGLVDCNGTCVDPNTDRAYCGAGTDCSVDPGVSCAAGNVCNGSGVCALSCQTGLTECGGLCTDTSINPNHCNGCGTMCATPAASTAVCAASTCSFICDAGVADCNNDANDGCEADLTADTTCGACDTSCGTGTTCMGGSCVAVRGCEFVEAEHPAYTTVAGDVVLCGNRYDPADINTACGPAWHVCTLSEWNARFTPGTPPGGTVSSFGDDQTVRCVGGIWEANRNDSATVWGGNVCNSAYNPWNNGKYLHADDATTILRGSGSCCGWDTTFSAGSSNSMAVYCCN